MTGRWPDRGDDRGSLALYLMIALVGLMLSALLVPMVVTSARSARFSATRVQAVDVAQAGVDVVLGKIRAATASDGLGDSSDLPCTTSSPITGSVGSASYSVTVDYYTVDPVKNASTSKMICVSGYGTYEASSGTATPSYARLTSVGTLGPAVNGTTAGRTLVTTYVLQTSSTNIAGGTIRLYPSAGSTTPLCMDAGSATPAASAAVTVATCSTTTPPAAQQTFAYRTDLTIQLVSSVTAAYPTGLCLSTAAPPAAGNVVVLKQCPASGAAPAYSLQWSFNDSGHYQASLSTSSTDGGLATVCVGVDAQSTGLPVKVLGCEGSTTSPTQAWIPSPSVGAGAAVAPQWVNASEFGRCIDVTDQNTSADRLIDYPCKQNPYGGAVLWNQKFTPPTPASGATSATGPMYTTTGGTRYCLTSPLTAGGNVTVSPCVSSQASQQWTVYGGDSTLSYSTKYTIVDSASRCLGLATSASAESWSVITVSSCSGSTTQKWNASPNLTTPQLQNTLEQ